MTHTIDPRITNFDPGKVATATGPRQQSTDTQGALPVHSDLTALRHQRPSVRRTTVGDVMSPAVVTLPSDAHVLEAAHHLIARGASEVVVVSGRRPLGVLTQRDLIRCWPTEPGELIRRRVKSLLPNRVSRLLPDLDIATAAAVLFEEELDAAPVVDRFGRLIGVFAGRHILALVAADDPLRSR